MTAPELLSVVIFATIGFLIVSYLLRSKGDSNRDEARANVSREAPTRDKVATWYEVLEISATATPDEIKTAYHRQIQKYHQTKFVISGLSCKP